MKTIFLLMLLLAGLCAWAEDIGPGTYHGSVATDRWGQHLFYDGTFTFYLSDAVAKQLAPFTGKRITVDATEVDQPMNPGGAMITRVGKVAEITPDPNLRLAVQVKAGNEVTVTVTSPDGRRPQLQAGALRLVVATIGRYAQTPPGFQDPDNRAFWYYHEICWQGNTKLETACREIPLAESKETGPGEEAFTTRVGDDLLPGEYEVYAYVMGKDYPQSSRVAFDVQPAGVEGFILAFAPARTTVKQDEPLPVLLALGYTGKTPIAVQDFGETAGARVEVIDANGHTVPPAAPKGQMSWTPQPPPARTRALDGGVMVTEVPVLPITPSWTHAVLYPDIFYAYHNLPPGRYTVRLTLPLRTFKPVQLPAGAAPGQAVWLGVEGSKLQMLNAPAFIIQVKP
jgi:hypothetical protein